MGQNNNCIQLKSNSYDVQKESILGMEGSNSTSKRSSRRPRLRSAFDVPAPLEEEGVILKKQISTKRRVSDPTANESHLPRKSVESFFARCAQVGRIRGPSLLTNLEGRKAPGTTSNRRSLSPSDGRRSGRTFWNFRSFSGRNKKDDQQVPISPNKKSRNRSASLGHVIVNMAHHKLRPSSGGASPDPRRSPVEKKPSEEVTPPRPQCTEYENGHHQPACVESLVKRCASCFDENGESVNGDFPRMLFLTHAWFMTSEQLVVLFSKLYEDENTPTTMKKQVFFAIRYWMKEFPHMFDLDAALVKAANDLQILATADDQVDATLIDLSNRGNHRWMRPDRLSVRPPQGAGRKRRKVSLVFHHLEPEELAIHMSYLEFKCFRRLTFEDFHKYAMHATIKNIARLERSVFLFNNITLWVQCMVLGQHTPQERAAVITKYIKISQKLREMRNYNTLMAVVGGLTHTAIARLKKTMSALSKDSVKALDELVEVLDSRSNYVAYRRDYAQQEGGFKLPVIGIHMKDIIGLHTAMLDRVGDGLINVKKMMSIGATFQELLNIQRTPFPHEVNKDLVNTLRVSLYLYYTEEEIYALSLQREPKDTKNSVSSAHSPSKINNMVFAEFTKFTCHLDNDTVTQHVTAMVESVFKAYDHDNDGFISEEEFDSFKDNFPMMESFSAMDVDRDGKISRSEMRDYFMKASAIRRNDFCQNFTHDFTETTYFHPTFCEECEKLLWGLVKQGWKCKGCGINCHKHCKDRIVQECRPKQSAANQQNNGQQANSTASSSSTKRNRGQEKSSVSSESDLSANGDVLTAIVNSSPQNQALEDEAFDSPTELNSSIQRNVSPSIMRRSTSLASADVTPRSLLRQIQDSKTPPPTRKVNQASPDHGSSGRRSFQRKMQKIIPRRNNSHKLRAMTDACTQTLPRSPTVLPTTPQFASTRSFLYPKAPETPKIFLANNERTHGERLGSTGEELDETHTSHLNNNHVIPRVMKQEICDVTTAMRDTRIQGRHGSPRHRSTDSILLSSTPPNHMSQTNNDQRHSAARRDSGLSGCSTFTLCERSVPATPNTFKFPPSFTYEEVPAQNTSKSEVISDLQEENFRLRETNAKLEKQLVSTKDYVKLLEEKLVQNGLKFNNPVVSKT